METMENETVNGLKERESSEIQYTKKVEKCEFTHKQGTQIILSFLGIIFCTLLSISFLGAYKVMLLTGTSTMAYMLIKQAYSYYIQGWISQLECIFWIILGLGTYNAIIETIMYANLY